MFPTQESNLETPGKVGITVTNWSNEWLIDRLLYLF